MIADIIKDRILKCTGRPVVLILKLWFAALMLMAGPVGFMFAFMVLACAGVVIKKDIYYILPMDRKQMKKRIIIEYIFIYIEVATLIIIALLIYYFKNMDIFDKYPLVNMVLCFIVLFFCGLDSLVDGQIEYSKGIYKVLSFGWTVLTIIIIGTLINLDFFSSISTLAESIMIIGLAIISTIHICSCEMKDYSPATEELNKRRKNK